MLREQRIVRASRAPADHGRRPKRASVLFGVDRCAPSNVARGSGTEPRSKMDHRRRRGRRGHEPQRAPGEMPRRRHDRPLPEWRGDSSRTGLSDAALAAGLRRKYEREMAAPAESDDRTRERAGRNLPLHRADAQWKSAPVHVRAKREVSNRQALSWNEYEWTGILRNFRPGMVRLGTSDQGGSLRRRREKLGNRRADRADFTQGAYAIPAALAMGWPVFRPNESRHRRERRGAAHQISLGLAVCARPVLSLQRNPGLARRGRRDGETCLRLDSDFCCPQRCSASFPRFAMRSIPISAGSSPRKRSANSISP